MPKPRPTTSLQGSFRVFELAGISVYVHWSWLVVAVLEIQFRTREYTSQAWNVAEYLTLFAIVLLHEFGHALACRQVGGQANEIILWPLGGIAFVNPPPRPGAWLWSIAAGPLVNVVLAPLTVGAYLWGQMHGLHETLPDANQFLFSVAVLNFILLVFNLLPIYPLDGGQMLQALLWFVVGRAKSLLIVSAIGMVSGVVVIVAAVMSRDIWFGILAFFVATRSWAGFQQARILARLDQFPRREEAACPGCGVHPFAGEFWRCDSCGMQFDTFAEMAQCPRCGKAFPETMCLECRRGFPIEEWFEGGFDQGVSDAGKANPLP